MLFSGLALTRTFVQNSTKNLKSVFCIFFGIYFSLVKKSTREKEKAKKCFKKSTTWSCGKQKGDLATWHLFCLKVIRSSF